MEKSLRLGSKQPGRESRVFPDRATQLESMDTYRRGHVKVKYHGCCLIRGAQERQEGHQDLVLIHLRVDQSNNF